MYFSLFTIFQESMPSPPPRYPLPTMESSVCDIMINGLFNKLKTLNDLY